MAEQATTEAERLRVGLDAAIRAASRALFLLQRHNVPMNDSWRAGFNRDLEAAKKAMSNEAG